METLRELVTTVNCQYHASARFIDQRVKSWTPIFPAGSGPPPLGEQIRDVIGSISKKCSGRVINAKEDRPCRIELPGQKIQNATRTLSELARPEVYSDEDDREYALEVIIENTFCYYHKRQGNEVLRSWTRKISSLCRDVERAAAARDDTPTTPSRIPRSRREGTPPSKCWPDAADISKFKTRIKPDRPAKGDTYALIQKELSEALDPESKEKGYVYALQVTGNEDYVKIGYTGRSVEIRAQEWATDCNRIANVVYPKTASPVQVPHAKRVEQLVLAELRHRSENVVCDACVEEHVEWVRAPVSEVVAVIEKWTAWIRERPYEECHVRRDGAVVREWRLTNDMWEKTDDMVPFMTDLAKRSGSAARSK